MARDSVIRFILVIVFQLLLLNNIYLYHYVTPLIYIYFILKLPFETPGWLLLLSSFLLGFVLDIFTATPGLQASVCLITAFLRPMVIRLLKSGREYEPRLTPGFRDNGLRWFTAYTTILVSLHIAALILVDSFGSCSLQQTFYRWLLNSALAITLILITEALTSTRKRKA